LIDPQQATENISPTRSREVSGQYLVIGLLLFGIAATILMFVYWDQHTRPFRSLREAIGREFRHSRPNVEGGRQKGRGPWTLRITMSVDFPPGEDSEQAEKLVQRILKIAREHDVGHELEKLEINLIQFVPQEVAKTRTFTLTLEDLRGDQPPPDLQH
jgi:hypothetical protein